MPKRYSKTTARMLRELKETIRDLAAYTATETETETKAEAENESRGKAEAEARAIARFERQFNPPRSPEMVARGAAARAKLDAMLAGRPRAKFEPRDFGAPSFLEDRYAADYALLRNKEVADAARELEQNIPTDTTFGKFEK